MTATGHSVSLRGPVHADFVHPLVKLFAGMFPAYRHGAAKVKRIIEDMVAIVNDPKSSDDETHAALDTLVEVLFPEPASSGFDLEDSSDFCELDATLEASMQREEHTFASNLKAALSKQGLSQKDLAKKVGVGQSAISMMIARNCRPQRRTVRRIAEALDLEPGDLWPGFSD